MTASTSPATIANQPTEAGASGQTINVALTRLPSGELWMSWELDGIAFTPAVMPRYHARKCYRPGGRSGVLFCDTLEGCIAAVREAENEAPEIRAGRAGCRCGGGA